jgi:hypothetical protein
MYLSATVTFLMKVFNTVICRQYFSLAWEQTCCVGIETELLPSYRPISLLDTLDKLFDKFLLTRVLW